MANSSSIEWTEATWNPVAGCSIVSPGCTNCYAMRMAGRLQNMGQEKYEGTTRITGDRHKWTGKIKFDYNSLMTPFLWKRPKIIFVNSMSDLFHESVPINFIRDVFNVIERTPHHTYQVLTKRSERLAEIAPDLDWPDNLWMGVSVESEDYWWRVGHLRSVPSAVRFLSLEPLLGQLSTLNFEEIHWVIAGGESGPAARPVRADWIREVRDACIDQGVSFHFKQWGGVNKKASGRILDDRTWDEWPASSSRHVG